MRLLPHQVNLQVTNSRRLQVTDYTLCERHNRGDGSTQMSHLLMLALLVRHLLLAAPSLAVQSMHLLLVEPAKLAQASAAAASAAVAVAALSVAAAAAAAPVSATASRSMLHSTRHSALHPVALYLVLLRGAAADDDAVGGLAVQHMAVALPAAAAALAAAGPAAAVPLWQWVCRSRSGTAAPSLHGGMQNSSISRMITTSLRIQADLLCFVGFTKPF
jgi:hypothetical protein